jgi:hypothetical protein
VNVTLLTVPESSVAQPATVASVATTSPFVGAEMATTGGVVSWAKTSDRTSAMASKPMEKVRARIRCRECEETFMGVVDLCEEFVQPEVWHGSAVRTV